MKDQFNTNGYGVRALTRGVRIVRQASVRIAGERYGGVCLMGWNGDRITVSCCDVYGVEYQAESMAGDEIGKLKLLRRSRRN